MTSADMPLDIGPFSVICRGCLSDTGEMKNMIEWGFAEDFYLFTDVPVLTGQSQGASEMLCSSCEESLIGCKRFRVQCQRSNLLLSDMGKRDSPRDLTADSNPELKEHKIVHTMNATGLTVTISTLDMDAKIYIPCPYKCGSSFIKQSDLHTHLVKAHNVDRNYPIELKYYCPHESCTYSYKGKAFTGRKFLNQHLNKKHSGEKTSCFNCNVNFSTFSAYQRHLKDCNLPFLCEQCNVQYKTHDRLLVHLKRKHPDWHEQYKAQRKRDKGLKRPTETVTKNAKKIKPDVNERHVSDYTSIYDSPKRSFATQTFNPEASIKNDVALPSWAKTDQMYEKSDDIDRNFSTIQTQTVFEDLLSMKSQNSEDDSIFFSETVSLSDIQTQTFPVEFGLSRKETITSETQTRDHSPDLSIKETQTCVCHYDSPKLNFKLFDSIGSSPLNTNVASTETQTGDVPRFSGKSDVLLSFHSTETQTCFEEKDL